MSNHASVIKVVRGKKEGEEVQIPSLAMSDLKNSLSIDIFGGFSLRRNNLVFPFIARF